MKTLPRFAIVFYSVALAGLIFIEMHGQASATDASPSLNQALAAQAAAAASAATDVAPPVAIPDFSRLVEQAGPAVVNIEAKAGDGPADRRIARDDSQDDGSDEGDDPGSQDIPEIFRRFFGQPGGPGMPMPPQRRGGTSFGTGFVISADGYLLTNHHVIDGADQVIVHFADKRELKAKVVGSDKTSDVALHKVDAGNLPVLKLGDSHSLKPGQWVMAIGSPFGFDHSVTAGVVSGLGRPSLDSAQRYVPFIQTDVAINPGNSGGPLMNTRGEVVGINSQIFSNSGGYMGVSFAIPIEVAMNAVRQLKETGHVSRGMLGVQIRDIQREELGDLGLARAAGALVASVNNGSAAAKAGIRPGDVILAFNGKDIEDSSDLPPMVGALPPGTRAEMKILRDGKTMTVSVVLAALEDATAANNGGDDSGKPAPVSKANPLGIAVPDVDGKSRTKLGLSAGQGVQVAKVGMLAGQMGLQPGDVILQVGKTAVGSVAQFDAATKGLKSGDRVRLLVRNADSTSLITLELP